MRRLQPGLLLNNSLHIGYSLVSLALCFFHGSLRRGKLRCDGRFVCDRPCFRLRLCLLHHRQNAPFHQLHPQGGVFSAALRNSDFLLRCFLNL